MQTLKPRDDYHAEGARRLKLLREAAGLSCKELEQKLVVVNTGQYEKQPAYMAGTNARVAAWESGREFPPAFDVIQLAVVLGTTTDYLLGLG